ncbi:hypothetical protein EAE96_001164 [Botrytis aclada]|nr:hypothetical protein EAE96_001164 [Botrytis aclada]
MYKRFLSTPRFQIVTWIMIGVNVAWILIFTFALMFSCLPIAGPWTGTNYKCVTQEVLFTVALGTDVATDVLVPFLPTYEVKKLQMPLSRKILIIGIFCLGGLFSIIGVVRIHFLTTIYAFLYSSHPQPEITWLYAPTYYWTTIETNFGVLSSRLPTLRLVLERVIYSRQFSQLTHLFSSSSSKTGDISLGSVEECFNFPDRIHHVVSPIKCLFQQFLSRCETDADDIHRIENLKCLFLGLTDTYCQVIQLN